MPCRKGNGFNKEEQQRPLTGPSQRPFPITKRRRADDPQRSVGVTEFVDKHQRVTGFQKHRDSTGKVIRAIAASVITGERMGKFDLWAPGTTLVGPSPAATTRNATRTFN